MRKALVLLLVVASWPQVAWAQDAPYDAPLPTSRSSQREEWWLQPQRPLPPPRPPRPRWVFFQLEGGPAYERLDGLSIYGGGGTAGADFELDSASVTLGATFIYGQLDGRDVLQFDVGTTVSLRAGVFRFGAGFGLGMLSISAITLDPSAVSAKLDFSLLTSVDLGTFGSDGKSAVYLGAKLRASVVTAFDAQPVVWGPVAVLGARL